MALQLSQEESALADNLQVTVNTNNGASEDSTHGKNSRVNVLDDGTEYFDTPGVTDAFTCESEKVVQEVKDSDTTNLIYNLTDTPPFYFLVFFAMQQCFLVISMPLSTTIVVAEVVCAQDDDVLKTRILSSTFFMMGLSTFAMTTFGVRLPIFQGPTPTYVIPLLILASLDEFKCPDTFYQIDPVNNSTILMAKLGNESIIPNRDISLSRINAYAGTLIMVGIVHFLIGSTGMVSLLARFVGPITIVPVILLFGIVMKDVIVSFAVTHWPTALLTSCVIIMLSLYLEQYDTPIPAWTPSRRWHVVWQPLHKLFSLFLSICIGWSVCAILTFSGALSEDKAAKEFLARTDARSDTVSNTEWFIVPYPGQFGSPGFSSIAVIPFLMSCILSVLDSIADYNASAKITSTPRPPKYALNRGIAVEGIMSILGGAFGCAHATVSFGENIGAIGISKVASRSVFQVVGLIYMVFALIGKLGAFFISIPYSVIGGTQIVTYGIFIGVILSYLESINLGSQRNVSILGISILIGVVIPTWLLKNPNGIDTGVSEIDNIIHTLLSNPSFVGGFVACVLDNTVPGTLKDRGIETHEVDVPSSQKTKICTNSTDVYRLPWLPNSVRRSTLLRYLPIFDKRI